MEGTSGKTVKREPPDDQERNGNTKSGTTAKVQHTNIAAKDEDKPAAKRAKLTLDMVTSNEEKAYLCKICFQVFGDEATLADHASIHTDKKPHRCNVCGAIFMVKKEFANHMAEHVSPDNDTKQEPESQNPTHTGEKPYQCVVCQKTFHKEKKLLKHQKKHEELKDDTVRNLVSSLSAYYAQNAASTEDDGEEKPYICQQCQVVFTSEGEYIAHSLTCTATVSKEHTCAMCLQTCLTKHMLITHLLKHNIYGCTVCDKMFVQKQDLAMHVKSHSETEIHVQLSLQETSSARDESKRKPYKCNLCDKSFLRQQNLSQHLKTHDRKRSWRCDKCDKTFQMQYSLDRHMLSAHRNNTAELQCAKCRKQFTTKSEFNRHLSAHAMENLHQCSECGESFSTNSELVNHAMIHVGEGDHMLRCSYCSKPFNEQRSLREHELTHYDERPHKCAKCDEAFVTKYKLQQHQRETGHYEVLPEGDIESMSTFYCHQCNRVFPVREQLLQHMKIIHGKGGGDFYFTPSKERPHQCLICGKTYKVKGHLNEHHMRTHSDEKPHEEGAHKCDVCGKAFRKKSELEEHVRSHARGTPYRCRHCNLSCKINDLEKHEVTCSARVANGDDDHDKGDYTCFLCDKKFQELSDLKTHVDNGQCKARFTCGDCDMTFDTDQSLFRHMTQHEQKLDRADSNKVTDPLVADSSTLIEVQTAGTMTQPRESQGSHQCPVCNKLFNDRMDLKEHIAIHATGQPAEAKRPFQCPECKKTFNDKWQFEEHCSTHTDDKPHQCDEQSRHGQKATSVSLAQKSQLQEHERARHGHKTASGAKTRHTCSVCNKTFNQKRLFEEHCFTHARYACTFCGKTFTVSGALKHHIDTFHVKKPFQCDLCPASFSSELRLSFHMDGHQNQPAPLDSYD